MGTLVYWAFIVVACFGLISLLFWNKLKFYWPWRLVSGTAATAIATASDKLTDIVTEGAFQTLLMAGWAADDLDFITMVAALRTKQRAWNTPVMVTPVVSPEVAALQAQVAALTKVVASQSTSTIPAAAVSPITTPGV